MEQKSASLTEAENRIKQLEAENKNLHEELNSTRSLYNQLVSEGKHEVYEERRVHLLKSQIIQLERQLALLSDALGARNAVLIDVENCVESIVDVVKGALSFNLGAVTLERDKLNFIVGTCESIQVKLYKGIERENPENLERFLLLAESPVVKTSPTKRPVTMMDVCSGKLDHLNLKYVSRLETKLMDLYRSLTKLHSGLRTTLRSQYPHTASNTSRSKNGTKPPLPSLALLTEPTSMLESLYGQTSHVCQQLTEVCSLLLQVSVLIPAAPWKPLQKPFIKDLSTDLVLDNLPPFPRNKHNEGRQSIEALIKAMNYSCYAACMKATILQDELDFHRAVYELQDDCIASMLQDIMVTCGLFEDQVKETLSTPLASILEKYNAMKLTASEDALKDFLTEFKLHADQLSDTVSKINTTSSSSDRKAALSQYCLEYSSHLKQVQADCLSKRDEHINELHKITDDLKMYENDIKELYQPKPPSDPKEEYQCIVNGEDSGADGVTRGIRGVDLQTSKQSKIPPLNKTPTSLQGPARTPASTKLPRSQESKLRRPASVTKQQQMPAVDSLSAKRGKVALSRLPKSNLTLQARPPWED